MPAAVPGLPPWFRMIFLTYIPQSFRLLDMLVRMRGKGEVNPSFEALSTLVKALGVSFDSIFDPASEQVEAELQEIAGLYRACPEQG